MKALTAIGILLLPLTLHAKPAHHFQDLAKVIRVDPIYQQVPVWGERCHRVTVSNEVPGTVAGAILGGALGNQIGDGNGRKINTVLGAVLGGALGNDAGRQGVRTERRCESVIRYHEQQLQGYDVTYRYHGVVQKTFMHQHPGKHIKVRVTVQPSA